MTKSIRIENACTSNFKVRILVQDRVYDHENKVMTDEWKIVDTIKLDYPTAMTNGLYITDSRRLIVEEYT